MDVDQPPAGETEMETDHQLPSIAAVKRLLGPRERLEKLLVDRHVRQGAQEMEDEILRLARENPEVFAADIVREKRLRKENRRSPLNYLMARRLTVSIETFEAVYDAFPAAIHSLDSFGDTVLVELLSYVKPSDGWMELLKAAINKSNAELAVTCTYNSLIVKALEKGCSEEEVQYMIDHHPGDPFHEHAPYQKTLLSAIV